MTTFQDSSKSHNKILLDIDLIFEKLHNLEKIANDLLTKIGDMNDKWLQFYPEFSSTYKLRSNLTENEYRELTKFRISVDDFYPYSAGLDQLLRDDEFINSNFTKMPESISAYLYKTISFCNDFISIIDDYDTIVK
jgi:hypothetical protein